jgi:hypothetical protein
VVSSSNAFSILFFLISRLADRYELIASYRHPGVVVQCASFIPFEIASHPDIVMRSGLFTSLLPDYHLIARGYCSPSVGFCLVHLVNTLSLYAQLMLDKSLNNSYHYKG